MDLKIGIWLPVLACVGLAVFAACGGGDSKDNGSKTAAATSAVPTSAATKATVETVAPTAKAAAAGKVPADACALLTLDEVHTVGPDAGAGKQSPQQGAPGQTVTACRWDWPTGVGSLDLVISTLPQGTSADMLKTSAKAEMKDKGHEVSGVGDFAVVWSPIGADTQAQALVNGLLVTLDLNVLGARDKQAEVEALLKAVAERM